MTGDALQWKQNGPGYDLLVVDRPKNHAGLVAVVRGKRTTGTNPEGFKVYISIVKLVADRD